MAMVLAAIAGELVEFDELGRLNGETEVLLFEVGILPEGSTEESGIVPLSASWFVAVERDVSGEVFCC